MQASLEVRCCRRMASFSHEQRASDNGGEDKLDIWLKQMAGGDPVRLTSSPGSKTNPQFSADGTKIYYLSGGDLFEIAPHFP